MRKELDNKLCTDFPLLYRDRHGDKRSTLMCWGFPGDGWYDLIYRLSAKLEPLIAAMSGEQREWCRAVQVKEKFGTLRFYMSSETDEMAALICEAESESARTCEHCGAPGVLRDGGWLLTLCDVCQAAR